MKRFLVAAGLIFAVGCSAVVSQEAQKNTDFTAHKTPYVKPVITAEQAKKKIEEYIKGTGEVSSFDVCEGNRYYIGQVYLKGYEGINVIRKIYVDKITGDIYPTMAETFDYCYMVKK
ncbi:hypothetical protein GWK41_04490 [Persephonella atlantica]|uniref:Lipoprotein n=1 Tax=Persephonella atlantica TaxID=2699429 RepID=A0ABS1GHA7_9AQUI|nr:hypothetical protein [Persephonella atlantica]MBK3332324.1 hypothetical protein [Persephonella atlantica]